MEANLKSSKSLHVCLERLKIVNGYYIVRYSRKAKRFNYQLEKFKNKQTKSVEDRGIQQKYFKCLWCNKSFPNKSEFESHLLIHTGLKPYLCDVCGDRFKSKFEIKRHHQIIHNGGKRKDFQQTVDMKCRMNIQGDVNNQECNVSGKQCARRVNHNCHMYQQASQKRFLCQLCRQDFKSFSDLRKHKRTHLKEKMCNICDKSFKSPTGYRNHVNGHMMGKQNLCNTCDASFLSKDSLKRHLQMHSAPAKHTQFEERIILKGHLRHIDTSPKHDKKAKEPLSRVSEQSYEKGFACDTSEEGKMDMHSEPALNRDTATKGLVVADLDKQSKEKGGNDEFDTGYTRTSKRESSESNSAQNTNWSEVTREKHALDMQDQSVKSTCTLNTRMNTENCTEDFVFQQSLIDTNDTLNQCDNEKVTEVYLGCSVNSSFSRATPHLDSRTKKVTPLCKSEKKIDNKDITGPSKQVSDRAIFCSDKKSRGKKTENHITLDMPCVLSQKKTNALMELETSRETPTVQTEERYALTLNGNTDIKTKDHLNADETNQCSDSSYCSTNDPEKQYGELETSKVDKSLFDEAVQFMAETSSNEDHSEILSPISNKRIQSSTDKYMDGENKNSECKSVKLQRTGNSETFISKRRRRRRKRQKLTMIKCSNKKISNTTLLVSGKNTKHEKNRSPVLSNTVLNRYLCNVCDKAFLKLYSFEKHKQVHDNELAKRGSEETTSNIKSKKSSKYDETDCQIFHSTKFEKVQISPTKISERHVQTSNSHKPDDSEFKCGVCDCTLKCLTDFKVHLLLHTGRKPHICEICGDRFRTRRELKRHRLFRHLDGKRHGCEFCEKRFTHIVSLQDHLTLHTGHKPYCCGVCWENFRSSSLLLAHMHKHTEEKGSADRFLCHKCGKLYRSSSSLNLHLRCHCSTQKM